MLRKAILVTLLLFGILKISNLFLSIIAGFIAITLFMLSRKRVDLRPWKILVIALVFFALQELLGALRAFNIFSTPYLTRIVPTVILGLLIFALTKQINITKK